MPLLSFSAYAKAKGVSRAAVTYAVKEGRIPVVTDPATGKRMIDKAAADRAWKQNTMHSKRRGDDVDSDLDEDSRSGGEADQPKVPSIHHSRQFKEAFQARIAKLEYEERMGKLVSADEVKASAFKVGRAVRDAVLNIPERLAAELAAETDQHKVHTRLRQELEKALEELLGGKF